ncbi:restriction endonuclease subunit S [Gemmatimonas sp.]|uniref:restriction endonuclease subunit S n=1 Tax=Gemmatimonas sp. TaxID=1962908 RepID=UPI00286E6B99|nr:restriction endonuclease subunit S [Gemmatimonas sp.]
MVTQTGPFGSQLHSYDYVPSGVPVIPTEAIGRRRLWINGVPEVSEETAARLVRHRLKAGDILFARRGVQATGLSAVVTKREEGWLCGTGAILLRVSSAAIDPEFLSFYLSANESVLWLKQHAVGAVMPNLNEGVIRSLPVTLPPIADQRAIAAILGALDDKIELNRRMNATLEATARALFQSWFVDFDPVRAKLDGRTPVGLDKTTAALFPDSFAEAEIGHAPSGWELRSLDKAAHFLNGLALQKYPPRDGATLPVIKIAQLRKGDSVGAELCSADLPSAYVVEDGDVLFSWSGSLEVELWCGGAGALNQHLFKVTSAEFPKWFYYLWTRQHLEEFRLIAADKATTMGHIQRGHLSGAKVLVPPRPLLEAMTEILAPLVDQIVAQRVQSRTLATLRDTLLPKLLSGELRLTKVDHDAGLATASKMEAFA